MREFPFMVFLSTLLAHLKFSKLNKISSLRETYMGKKILFEFFDNITIASEDCTSLEYKDIIDFR